MEWAFAGPKTLHAPARSSRRAADRRDGSRRVRRRVLSEARRSTASRRRWASASTTCARCITDEYDGDASNLWRDVDTGAELYRRLRALPGYGDEKSKIFVAILAKRRASPPRDGARRRASSATTRPARWPTSTVPKRSAKVREWKKAQKAAKRTSRTARYRPDGATSGVVGARRGDPRAVSSPSSLSSDAPATTMTMVPSRPPRRQSSCRQPVPPAEGRPRRRRRPLRRPRRPPPHPRPLLRHRAAPAPGAARHVRRGSGRAHGGVDGQR